MSIGVKQCCAPDKTIKMYKNVMNQVINMEVYKVLDDTQ